MLHVLGEVDEMVHIDEYKKHGLPHAHVLLVPKAGNNPRCADIS